MTNKKHELHNQFNEKETVYVKSKDELESLLLDSEYDMEEWQHKHFMSFAGMKTEIDRKYYLCCKLDVDKQFTWSYNWISKLNNHLDDDLFEL